MICNENCANCVLFACGGCATGEERKKIAEAICIDKASCNDICNPVSDCVALKYAASVQKLLDKCGRCKIKCKGFYKKMSTEVRYPGEDSYISFEPMCGPFGKWAMFTPLAKEEKIIHMESER